MLLSMERELTKKSYIESNFLKESINIIENKTVDKAILFTDMVESSKAWKNNPEMMIKAIEAQSKVVDKWVKKYKGFICKTIGDAYMLIFDKLEPAINCGISIQEDLKENPILIGKTKTQLRIGICFGPVYESLIDAQNLKLKDYFGNTVNTASRIESKVSDKGNIAFAIATDKGADLNLDDILKDKKVELISFSNKGDEISRSSRALTEIHRHIYKNINELKGIEKIDVYKVKI